ncbi:MAG: hypothetical protein JWQ72_1150 [Polaromonas sp.]|nr:hypothetical protein [Polaromonas sp.]
MNTAPSINTIEGFSDRKRITGASASCMSGGRP